MEQSRRKGTKGVNNEKKRGKYALLHDIKDSFTYKGKFSARKLTVFISFVMFNVLATLSALRGLVVQEIVYYVYATIILMGLGYLTAENIVDIVRARFKNQNMFVDYEQDNQIFTNRNRINNPDELQQNSQNGQENHV